MGGTAAFEVEVELAVDQVVKQSWDESLARRFNIQGGGRGCPPYATECLHAADSDVAADVLHARKQYVSRVEQACRPDNIPECRHGCPFTLVR